MAYPLLSSEMPATRKLPLNLDVVYVYIGNPDLNANVTGMWRNYTASKEVVEHNGAGYLFDLHAVSYLVVLNVTNISDTVAYITNFDLIVGPQIFLPSGNSGVGAGNPILMDNRIRVDLSNGGFNSRIEPNESRLVRLSGFSGVHDIAYEKLKSDPIYVYASADGQAIGADMWHSGNVYKQIDFQEYEGNYLYNRLVAENQVLAFYRTYDVYVATRR